MIFFLGKYIFIAILAISIVNLLSWVLKSGNKNEDDDFNF